MTIRKEDSMGADARGNPLIGLKQTNISDVVTTGATSTTPFGYSEAQANAIVSRINLINAALRAHGLI